MRLTLLASYDSIVSASGAARLYEMPWRRDQSVATRVFRTRRGRITLTDERLEYDQKRDPHWHASVARADIVEVQLVPHVYWFSPAWIEVRVRHRGGVLSIPQVGRRMAETLRAALGF
jgi:hypothetical protein